MAEGRGIGDLFRKIVSFALLVAAVIALIAFFIGANDTFAPFTAAFSNGFDFGKFGYAIYDFMNKISVPLIMSMLGLLGLTIDR